MKYIYFVLIYLHVFIYFRLYQGKCDSPSMKKRGESQREEKIHAQVLSMTNGYLALLVMMIQNIMISVMISDDIKSEFFEREKF